jgi:hypothetical protein
MADYIYRVLKSPQELKDKSCKNIDYMETIRGKCWQLKDKGITYKAMAEQSGVGVATIRNFSSCLRDSMNPTNWNKFRLYVEKTHKQLFG